VFEGFSDEDVVCTNAERAEEKAVEEEGQNKRYGQQLVESKIRKIDPASKLEKNIFLKLDSNDATKEVDVSSWKGLELSSVILSSLSKLGFASPTSIQATAIPEILSGHDVIGKAPTGSGKTLAFGIPILEKWLERNQNEGEQQSPHVRKPIALILSPTRELAHQLGEHIISLCAGIHDAPYVAVVTGGMSLQKQQRQLQKADIVIGTPGRLWEVMSSSVELQDSFRTIDFLVVDEADRLLTDGHFKEAEEIINSLDRIPMDEGQVGSSPARQTLVFSATFHQGLQQKLTGKGKRFVADLNDPMEYLLKKLNFREENLKYIDVNPVSQMAEGLREGIVECAGIEKVWVFIPSYSSRVLIMC
jgi:ATP-dependent RNA helicase DDX24/MAK5